MINVSADDEWRDMRVRLFAVRQHREHVTAFFLLLLDHDVGRERAFAVDAAHQIASVELVLEFLERLAGAHEQFITHRIGHADRRDAAGGQRGIKRHRRELLHDLGVRPADNDEAACALLASSERLVAQAGVAAEFIPPLLRDAFRQVTENEHPFVLHIEMRVARIGLDGGRFGRFDAVTGKDDLRGLHFAVLGEGERFPVLVNGQGLAKVGQGVAFAERHTGGEVKVVEVGVVIAEGREADLLRDIREILRG